MAKHDKSKSSKKPALSAKSADKPGKAKKPVLQVLFHRIASSNQPTEPLTLPTLTDEQGKRQQQQHI
jgi:hypothetical protein